MKILLISGSLNPNSRSRILVKTAEEAFKALPGDVQTQYLDLRDYPLPLCDGEEAYDDPQVDELSAIIKPVDAVVCGVPVYNFDANAALKNLVELTGSAWENKIVGFLCAAGGRSSYMSVMSFANSLMLDFRCLIVPRFVYAVKGDFENGRVANPDVAGRIAMMAKETALIAGSGYASYKAST